MKRFPKLIVTLLLVALAVGIFSAIPVAAATEYEEFIKIKARHVEAGHYTTLACDGELVQHSANKNYREEVGCLVDNDNRGAYWSKPYKFSALKDNGGTTVPAAIFDVAAANGNEPLAVAAFDLRLRSAYDCKPLHVVLQATTSADSNNWETLADKKFTDADWDANPKQRLEFPEKTVYKLRLLVYDIGDVDVAADEYNDYIVCKGDETRFTLSEIGIMTIKKGGSSNSGSTNTTTPTSGQSTTRPVFTIPVGGGQSTTQAPTQAPTQAATKAPTQAPTQKPTTSQGTTVAPTQAPTQTATVAPTGTATTPTDPTVTVAPTDPTGTVDPSAPTDPTGTVDPSAPTVDPSAPTDEPTAEPTQEPTAEPTVEATEPDATTGETDDNGTTEPKEFPWIIVAAIAAVAVVAGVAVFFIIKKKKNG